MGKGKLQKFSEMSDNERVIQPLFEEVWKKNHWLKGKWGKKIFHNNNDIILEIGCGKGEYTIALAKKYIDKNFIGIDIKGARMWKGAKEAKLKNMVNVAFLRTRIELLTSFFAKNEISEIWLTFPDPQMKKIKKRLISERFLSVYKQILRKNGTIHLKTDSKFLFEYTKALLGENNITAKHIIPDICKSDEQTDACLVETHYEKQFSERGIPIKYIRFELPQKKLTETDVKIEFDTWRSYGRDKR